MKFSTWIPMAILLPLCLSLTGVEAQEGADEREGQAPFRVEVDAVNVLAAVHDNETREFVTDLTKEDFQIYEDGVLQTITNFTQQTDLPLTIALCMDTSSSVRLKLDFEKEAATDFLYAVMRPSDRAMLVEFDTGVTLLHDFTSNPNDLVREINLLKAGGGTSLYDAVYLVAEQKMLNEPGRKTVVILSDGADLTSKHSFEEMLRMAYQAEITVYAISTTRFGADIDHEGDNALKQLTEVTGGTAFFPYSTDRLASAFQEVDQELRSQYNLTYVPTNKDRDGTFREIKVKVNRDGVRLRHRKGYFAPERLSSANE
ncbi:MAG: VWA domain-containing protein [Acidobacteria bacterium]|nr:VWA domain-containing protein [Acidobacteriota bacterium]MCZ6877069.1 VWA domain-containing protein [Acidobacteriota bacterium]